MLAVEYSALISESQHHRAALKSSSAKETLGQFSPSSRKVCFSFAAYAKNIIGHLRKCHIPISEGLSDEEFLSIESTFGFVFPPDLRSILQEGLPIGEGFPNWRSSFESEIRTLLHLPVAAICREISRRRFWCPVWGNQPDELDECLRIASKALQEVPPLVPIYGGCYIACFPILAGNPIFLVNETRIYYCGYDIADFFKRQAFVPRRSSETLVAGSSLPSESKVTSNHGKLDNLKTPASKAISKEAGQTTAAANGNNIPTWRWNTESPRTPELNHTMQSASVAESLTKSAVIEHAMQRIQGAAFSDHSPKAPPGEDIKIVSKYLYFHEKPLPNRMLTRFTMAAPPWAAKAARKIEFWSELAEGTQKQRPKVRMEGHGLEKTSDDQRGFLSKSWLSDYLEELASMLRGGCWADAEIREMMESHELKMEGTNTLSVWLQQAGWNAREVMQMLSCALQ